MAKVSIDYHLEVDGHYYSVPYQLTGERCEVRLGANAVEIFCRGRRVASHLRSRRSGGFTTDAAHPQRVPGTPSRPAVAESHRRHLEWTPGRLLRWAEETGPATAQLVDGILRSRPHPEQGFRSCLGIFRLGRTYGSDRLEAACRRALALQAFSYRSVQSILKTGLDRQPLLASVPEHPVREHANVRGADYYR
jgi:transposase